MVVLTHFQLQLQLSGLHYHAWNVCTFAVCIIMQPLSSQLPQMTVTALLVFYGYNRDLAVCSLQSELINHQTHLERWQLKLLF